MAAALALGGFRLFDDKRDVRLAPRELLIGYCWFTTLHADFRVETKDKWDWCGRRSPSPPSCR